MLSDIGITSNVAEMLSDVGIYIVVDVEMFNYIGVYIVMEMLEFMLLWTVMHGLLELLIMLQRC